MKYLRKFIESRKRKNYDVILSDLSENYLSYLLDDGYKFSIGSSPIDQFCDYDIDIYIDKNTDSRFNWFDVRDEVLPFILLLKGRIDTVRLFSATFYCNGHSVCIGPYEDKSYDYLSDNDISGIKILSLSIKIDRD